MNDLDREECGRAAMTARTRPLASELIEGVGPARAFTKNRECTAPRISSPVKYCWLISTLDFARIHTCVAKGSKAQGQAGELQAPTLGSFTCIKTSVGLDIIGSISASLIRPSDAYIHDHRAVDVHVSTACNLPTARPDSQYGGTPSARRWTLLDG
jgi:hypothetical protein